MAKQYQSIGSKRINWQGRLGRLALVVFSVVCLTDTGVHAIEKGDLSGDGFLKPASIESNKQVAAEFDWGKVHAGPDLNYTKCYAERGDFQCAKLQLPMDYWNSSIKDKVVLAVIRKPAKVNVTSPMYGGAIQVNPGGPGDSGIGFVVRDGNALSNIVDTPDTKTGMYFDILSFDPRGVGLSTPQMECPDSDISANSSKTALENMYSMFKEKGQKCSVPSAHGQVDVKRYITTACVAQDMVSLVDAHGHWREQEGGRITAQGGKHPNAGPSSRLWYHRPGLEKLQYWGLSYGSHLGTTFAAMFPDRIKRMIVDGVVDAEDYTKGLENHDLDDAEKALDQFYSACARAGHPQKRQPDSCALANETDSSTSEGVEARVQTLLRTIREKIGQWMLDVVEQKLFDALETPSELPGIAQVLANIEEKLQNKTGKDHEVGGIAAQAPSVPSGLLGDSPYMGIACTDADDQSAVSEKDFEKHLEQLRQQSPVFGTLLAANILACVGYGIRPAYRFIGPWAGNTSHPILLIGNTADPITPLRNANKMAKGFEGAVVLTQNSTGHSSLSTRSDCTEDYVRKYFRSGELPPSNAVCSANHQPFENGAKRSHKFHFDRKPFPR